AAALGGTQSLHTNSKDEALALPTESSVRIALRTQQIVAYESGVAETVDPLAGSYYVEAMTNDIEAKAMEYIKKIDDMGGASKAIERGFIQQEIQDSAFKYQMEIEAGDRIIVGMNKFQIKEDAPKGLLRVDPVVGELQRKKLETLRAERDNNKVNAALEALRKAAQTDENLMPFIIDAVKTYATLGEISQVLRDVFGEYQQSVIL
ncbi:MAG: methylmalonyl-CoA mutase, partial [Clostridia bacterium]|nr:methylmalonyl-CoA mutase [Clostridia bacterium]